MSKWMAIAFCLAAMTASFSAPMPAASGRLRELLAQRRGGDPGDGLDSSIGARGPFPLPTGTQVERDLAYGTDPAQRLDVYRPADAHAAPVILMVHGGAWRTGDKDMQRVVKNKVQHWVARGWLLVSIDYRLLPDADPLLQADDVGKALAFAQSQARQWGGDPARFVLMGHSAGAHLVALITADPTIATRQGARPWLGTVALDSAAYDVSAIMDRPHLPLYDQAFGSDPAYWRRASPLDRLAAAPVPMLLVCSSQRRESCPQAQAFAARATALGGRARTLPEALSHAQIDDELGTPGRYTASVDDFLRSLGLR